MKFLTEHQRRQRDAKALERMKMQIDNLETVIKSEKQFAAAQKILNKKKR